MKAGMAAHFSVLVWKLPWTEEPGGPQSIGSQRVRHDRNDLACTQWPKGTLSPDLQAWGCWGGGPFKEQYFFIHMMHFELMSHEMKALGLSSGPAVENLPAMQGTWI